MTVAYGSVSSATKSHGGGSDTLTITKPTGLAVGDFMIAGLFVNGSNADFDLTGWTSLIDSSQASNYGLNVLWKIADSADVAATNFSFQESANAGDGMAGFIVRITGSFTDADNLIASAAINNSAISSHTFTPGITPNVVNTLLLMGSGITGTETQSAYAVANNNPTWTERVDVSINTTSDAGISLATASLSAIGATGDFSLTLSSSRQAIGFLIAVTENTSVNGNHPILAMSSDLLGGTISVGTTANHALLAMSSHLFSTSALVERNGRWVDEEMNTKTWEDEVNGGY